MREIHWKFWGLVAVLLVSSGFLFYTTERIDTLQLQVLYALSFATYVVLGWVVTKKWNVSIKQLLIAGLLLRAALLFDLPNLSDDYFRYTWDAHLTNTGKDPYEYRPIDYIQRFPDDTLALNLFQASSGELELNSKKYYSIYPSISQLIFSASLYISGSPNLGNVILIKFILLLFELGTAWVLLHILTLMGKPRSSIIWYWLNPLAIIELVGNAHLDGVAIFFLLLAFYMLIREKRTSSALSLAAAVATKLNPVFLAVVSVRNMPFKKWMFWSLMAGIFSVVFLAIFLDLHNIHHVKWSFRLYFFSFHFNSSFMNAVRGIMGQEAMEWMMDVIPKVTLITILSINFLRKNWGLSERLLLAYSIYYFFGTTVHPWYVITLLPFAIISEWKFPIAWSYLIFLTYSFYKQGGVDQIGWVVGVEYGILFLFIVNDLYRKIIRSPFVEYHKIIR